MEGQGRCFWKSHLIGIMIRWIFTASRLRIGSFRCTNCSSEPNNSPAPLAKLVPGNYTDLINYHLNMKYNYSLIFNYLLAFIGAGMAGCTAERKMAVESNADQEFPVIQIIAKDTVVHLEYVADIRAVQNVELRARVEGFLEKVYVDEGQEVKKGQLLFKLNDEEYKEEVAKARANLQSAVAEAKGIKLEIDRLRLLVEKNVISKTEIDVAQAKLDAANSRIGAARSTASNAATRLSYTRIRAPFDGIIDRIPYRTGSLIDHGALLTTASNISAIFVYFNVSENEYLQYIKTQQLDPQL